jgi:hypothetical protein
MKDNSTERRGEKSSSRTPELKKKKNKKDNQQPRKVERTVFTKLAVNQTGVQRRLKGAFSYYF